MSSPKNILHLLVVCGVGLLTAPRMMACATCFGASDSKMAQGMNVGILTLLAVVGLVLGGTAMCFVVLGVRAHRAAADDLKAEGGPPAE
jgi:hypothetical protein